MDIKPKIQLLQSLGFETNPNMVDAMLKWSVILGCFDMVAQENTAKVPIKVLDLGGGIGPLKQILSKTCHVVAVDNERDSAWFEIPKSLKSRKAYIESLTMDANVFLANCHPNSFDFVIDSCSTIHFYKLGNFMKFNKKLHKKKINKIAREIERVLKPGGHFIFVTDVARDVSLMEIQPPELYLNAFTQSGLENIVLYNDTFLRSLELKNFNGSKIRTFPTTTSVFVELGRIAGVFRKTGDTKKSRTLLLRFMDWLLLLSLSYPIITEILPNKKIGQKVDFKYE